MAINSACDRNIPSASNDATCGDRRQTPVYGEDDREGMWSALPQPVTHVRSERSSGLPGGKRVIALKKRKVDIKGKVVSDHTFDKQCVITKKRVSFIYDGDHASRELRKRA